MPSNYFIPGLESEAFFRGLINEIPVPAILFKGSAFIIEFANDEALKLFGREKRAIGHPLLKSVPELLGQPYYKMLAETFSSACISKGQEMHLRIEKDGELKNGFINFTFKPLTDDSGKVTAVVFTGNDVTELVEARNAIMEIEERSRPFVDSGALAAIVEYSNDAIISTRLDGVIVSWNQSAERIYGYRKHEILGENIIKIIPPENRGEEKENIERLKKEERIEHFETRRITKNGRILDVSITISPVKDLKGNIIGVSKMSRDITEQKEAARRVKESEDRLQLVIQASELGIWEFDLKTKELKHSEKHLEIFGYPDNKIISYWEILKHLHPADRAESDKAYARALETGKINLEIRIVKTDGAIRWIEVKGKLLYDEKNQPAKLIGTIKDVTDKIYAIEELRESEKKFRQLADALPQLIWTGNERGVLTYFNQAFFSFSGLTFDELSKGGWMQLLNSDEREESVKRWAHSVTTGEPFLFEHRFRRGDGEYRWQLSRAVPQKDKNGNIYLWVGTSTDIHEQKTFARELEKKVAERTKSLQEANDGLEKINQELASFAYVSSHDLQEPLRKIQTFALHILEMENKNLSETGKDYFDRIQKAANRMQKLIADLLTYSRTNTKEKKFELTDLNLLLQEVKNELEEFISEKRADVKIGPMPQLKIIPYQFRQLFTNLLSNSLKFSKKNEPVQICITAGIIEGKNIGHPGAVSDLLYHHITITDTGIGFAEEFREKIFEVFQRLHGRSEYEGTGIGLAIAKKIVENHNGIINATAEQDKGARFNVYLPAE